MVTDTIGQYDFSTAPRILFGWGRRRELGEAARTLGQRAFLLCGSRSLAAGGVIGELAADLHAHGVTPIELPPVTGEPEVADVGQATATLLEQGAGAGDLLVAVGGGSALDLAKAVSAMVTQTESQNVVDYLEGVGRGLSLTRAPLPLIAMPTTSGTGSEVTRNAVISSYDPAFKKSLRDVRMLPDVALVDPELTVGLPPEVTAHTGMDAITQLIESYISCRSQPLPRALVREALPPAVAALARAVRQGDDRLAREAMSHAALVSGMTLANSGLGMAHGVAAALGVHCRIPHGLACAVMLPVALRVNRPVRERAYAELARAMHAADDPAMQLAEGHDTATAADALVARIEQLTAEVEIPTRLSTMGVRAEQLPAIVASSRGNSMRGNPCDFSDDTLLQLLEEIL